MKRRFIGVAILAAVACAGLISAQEFKGPKLVAGELQYDFGKITEGTEAVHVFEIRSAGTGTLIIERIQTS